MEQTFPYATPPSPKEPILPALGSETAGFQNCETVSFCYLTCRVCGPLLRYSQGKSVLSEDNFLPLLKITEKHLLFPETMNCKI